MADPDLSDPTYGYFVVFENPPPHVRNLPAAHTATDAILETRTRNCSRGWPITAAAGRKQAWRCP